VSSSVGSNDESGSNRAAHLLFPVAVVVVVAAVALAAAVSAGRCQEITLERFQKALTSRRLDDGVRRGSVLVGNCRSSSASIALGV
jgi:hypothetical protein